MTHGNFFQGDAGSPTFTCVIEPEIEAVALELEAKDKDSKAFEVLDGNPDLADNPEALDKGALADGPEVNIFEIKNIGFLLQYFAVGVIYGGLPATVYGFFLGYLAVPAYIYATAGVIMNLPWCFKFFFGLMNDCMPIFGYRRKPYMVFGWSLCFIFLVLLSQRPLPKPYWCIGEDGEYLKDQDPCNPQASSQGGEFAMLMCAAALGYVIADVAADGLMVQIARREPESHRGRTQTTVYLVRTLGSVCATGVVGLGMNGKVYDGTFDVGLSFNQVMGIFAVPAGLMIPLSWFLIMEDKVTADDKFTFRGYFRSAWQLLKGKAFFAIVLYMFFSSFIGGIATPAGGLVKSEWAGVKNFQNQIFSLTGLLLFSFGLWQVKKRFLHVSWRLMLLVTTVVLQFTDMIFVFLTIFDVVRNQYFYLGESVLLQVPAAAGFVVSTFIMVEMSDDGNEGLTYGLLTTISNTGSPFASAVANQLFGAFKPNLSDVKNYINDTTEFRRVVAASFALSYFFAFFALIFLWLLPAQKQEAQRRKKEWTKRTEYAAITVSLLAVALMYTVAVDILTMIPATECLKIVGGEGC